MDVNLVSFHPINLRYDGIRTDCGIFSGTVPRQDSLHFNVLALPYWQRCFWRFDASHRYLFSNGFQRGKNARFLFGRSDIPHHHRQRLLCDWVVVHKRRHGGAKAQRYRVNKSYKIHSTYLKYIIY